MGFLDIRNVTKSYGSVQVLHRVDVAVNSNRASGPQLVEPVALA